MLDAAGRAERPRQRLGDDLLCTLGVEGSAWTRPDVEREVAARLPAVAGAGALGQVREVQRIGDQIIVCRCVDLAPSDQTEAVRRELGRPSVQRYTTTALVEQEQRILRWFLEAAARGGGPLVLGAGLAVGLSPEQAQAASLVAGSGRLVVVVGPAGTGKTRAMRAAVAALRAQGRPVLGVATSARAAAQLERDAGVCADTVQR